MQLRCTIRGQQLDVINIYQHGWSTHTAEQNKELVGKRRSLWLGLDKLLSTLGRLPWRSSLLMAGDFNSVLETRTGVSGYGIFSGGQQPEVVKDRSMPMDVLARSQIADARARDCQPQKSFLAGWRSAGHLTLRARIPLFWKPWKGKTSPNQAPETLPETLEQAQSPRQGGADTPAKVPIPGHIQVGAEVTAYWRHRQRLMALSGVNYRRAIFATTCQNADRAQIAEGGHSSQEAGATPGDAAPR